MGFIIYFASPVAKQNQGSKCIVIHNGDGGGYYDFGPWELMQCIYTSKQSEVCAPKQDVDYVRCC